MRIVFVLSGTTLQGGATKSFLLLHDFLVNKGVDVLVVTPDKDGIYIKLKENNNNVISLKYKFNTIVSEGSFPLVIKSGISYFVKSLYNYFATNKLISICKTFKPDIIHTNTSVNNIGYLAAKRLHIPHIWHLREYGDIDFNFKVPFLDKMINGLDNYTISITKGIAKYKKVYNKSNSRVIYNGIVQDYNIKSNVSKSFFLYAGRIEFAKGVMDLIIAYINLNKLIDVPYPLRLAGRIEDNTYFEKIQRLITNANLSNKIEFLGEVKEIHSLITGAVAVIVPSINEGFGRVMPEAMSYGCLCIGRDTAGTKEQMDNGLSFTGEEIALRFLSVDELTSHLKDISLNGCGKYSSMIYRAKKTVQGLYSLNNYGDNVYKFYKDILKKSC